MGLGIEPCAQLGLKQSADSLMKKYDLCSRACRGGWIFVIRRWGSNGRSAQMLLKNSEIEPLRKSRFRARRVTSADSSYRRAYGKVAGGKTGRSAEPLRNFASRLPAVF
jgi:hypothetical protein